MQKLKRILFILVSVIVMIVVVVIVFISPITKYLIEKYDQKYTGREISLDWAYVNPFTGYVYLDDLEVKEFQSDSVFLATNSVSANFEMSKLFSKSYIISKLVIDEPKGHIIQEGDKHNLNFKDIIEKFSPKDKNSKKKKEPVRFSILQLVINDGVFYYHESVTPINYFIKKVNVDCGGIRWDADTIPFNFSFLSGTGTGEMKGDFTINTHNQDYHLAVDVKKFDLNIIEQYLKDLTNYGEFSAILDANVKSKGNLKNKENVSNSGLVSISDFHYGKSKADDYTAFDKLTLAIKELSPKKHQYLFDSVSLNKPYGKFEKYDYLDNFQRMFGTKGSNVAAANSNPQKFNLIIEIAKYVKVLSKNFFKSNYKVGRLAIYNGDLRFNDFSQSEQFSAGLQPFTVIADSIDKSNESVNATLRAGIKPYGSVAFDLSINPKDSSDFDIVYHVQKVPTSMFNPYSITNTSFPLDRGTIDVKGKWHVRDGYINSENHLVLLDPRLGNRSKNKDTRWIPMKIVMFFIRERGNVIDYDIPIKGDLKDPKFCWSDVVIDAVENIFIKPVTTPYRFEVKQVETEIEKSLAMDWEHGHYCLQPVQETFVEKISDFLLENPNAHIDIYPNNYTEKEKEYLLFFEAKKKFYMLSNNVNERTICKADSERIDKMSVKDSLFIWYLNRQTNDSMLFTVQAKCEKLIGRDVITNKFEKLNKERTKNFMVYFKKKGLEKQVKLHGGKSIVPYNGFSFYKITYKEQFPETLLNAYHKMDELNSKEPRKKFRKLREKTKDLY